LGTLEDSVTYVIWLRQLLLDLGYAQDKPTCVYQDNKRLQDQPVWLFKVVIKRTKHMICKEAFICKKFQEGAIVFGFFQASFMLADILTKLVSSTVLNFME
jgi:hypothetical protein